MEDEKMSAYQAIPPITKLQSYTADDGIQRKFIVDFDHTLMLSNSTEEFLNCGRPSSIVALLLKAIGALKPWMLFGENGYKVWRDVIRVSLVLLLAPWTVFLFKKKSKTIFQRRLNTELDKILESVDINNIVIVSFGFDFVLKALVKGSKYEQCQIVAPSIGTMAKYRSEGKLSLLKDHGLNFDTKNDVVITDSEIDDADLLAEYANGVHIEWPNEVKTGAFAGIYLPFYYTAQIKRDPTFFLKQVVLEELPIILIAFGFLATSLSWTLFPALTLLFAAYIAVYEIGYAENDRIGFETEDKPKLTDNFYKNKNYKLEPQAWLWAIGFSILGFLALDQQTTNQVLSNIGAGHISGWQAIALLSTVWMGLVTLGRLLFWHFNHLPVLWRVYSYLPLHVCKYFAPAVLFSCHPIAFALLCAHVVRTWALYAIRRAEGNIEVIASQLTRLIFLLLFIPIFGLAVGQETIWLSWQVWLIIGFCVVRAIPEIRRKLI